MLTAVVTAHWQPGGMTRTDLRVAERAEELADGRHFAARTDGLAERLIKLDSSHPSAAGYGSDLPRSPDQRPQLTDAERAGHIAAVRENLADARARGLVSDRAHTTDELRKIWVPERVALQEQIVNDLHAAAGNVPCEGKAILAGGLPGSGKTTVLTEQAGIDLSGYLMINPDKIKEEMATRGMMPDLPGLSPMEASDLLHAESSLLARRLAARASADGRNLIWDVTMSSADSTMGRITDLRAAGYEHVEMIFVDIPVEVSVGRAEARYWKEHEQYLAGNGLGGRYVPPELIRAQADAEFGSANRRAFELAKPLADAWRRFDNGADDEPARLAGHGAQPHELTGGP
jgi:predicted ABC-type ATPase